MTACDPELYLRLAAERLLAAGPDPYGSHEASPLTVQAQALVAAGVIDGATVTALLADYLLASAVRGDVLGRHRLAFDEDEDDEVPVPAEPLESARVVACDIDLELPIGSLHVSHVRLSKRETTVAAIVRTAGAKRRSQRMMASGGAPGVTLTDDRGTSRTAHLSGSGSDTGWDGHFQAQPGLAVDTRFIEIDGARFNLEGDVQPARVWLEPLPALDPALSYLWHCVTPAGHMSDTPAVEPAIDALVACGALSAGDPGLAAVRAVAEATGRGRRHGGGAKRKQLPEPWRSALAGRTSRGPDGVIAVSASSPVFDGFAVAVSALESDEDGWRVEVEAAPGVAIFSPLAAPRARTRGLVWWAADDRRHHHLGRLSDWRGGAERGAGTIEFETPLDPKATYVDLRATATTQRAVIRVPLEWA